jgi:hypothetical protein
VTALSIGTGSFVGGNVAETLEDVAADLDGRVEELRALVERRR